MMKLIAIPTILALALVGCAKQPSATTGASAPAPGGAVGMTVSPGAMQAASATAGGQGAGATESVWQRTARLEALRA